MGVLAQFVGKGKFPKSAQKCARTLIIPLLCTANVKPLSNSNPAEEQWVTYGLGKHLQNLPVHSIATSLRLAKAMALPMSHTLIGCDTI